MLHVFFGTDTIAVRTKAHQFLEDKAKGDSVTHIDSDSYTSGLLADIAGASSLFGGGGFYFLDTPSLSKDFFADVIEHLSLFEESPNTFVIVEEHLLAPEKKKFKKFAQSIEEYKKAATERFNAFSMADSLLKKDKRLLWVGLQEAKKAGLSAEEIIGTLWWQLKTLRLVQLTQSSAEAGMKDFPYNKAKRASNNFTSEDVAKLSQSLLGLYHDGHRGKVDIDVALEKWVLTI